MNKVELHEDLIRELEDVPESVISSLAKRVYLLQDKGTSLSPPYAKIMKVPKGTQPLANLRFDEGGGIWRVTYCLAEIQGYRVFLLLAVGNKRGIDRNTKRSKRFNDDLIQRSQQRLEASAATVVWP